MSKGIVIFDIDGVIRDVGQSYRRAIADTVAHYTQGAYRPSNDDIDRLKTEGIWNNDWKASQELIHRWDRQIPVDYQELVAFFQEKYRGHNFDGYINDEPILVTEAYFQTLTASDFAWGFFSGAMRGSAGHILTTRLGLENPVLVAMEDAPEKPDPTGLFAAIAELEAVGNLTPVAYVGDTAADMQTITHAKAQQPERQWRAVGVIPPHARTGDEKEKQYATNLKSKGADLILPGAAHLSPTVLNRLF